MDAAGCSQLLCTFNQNVVRLIAFTTANKPTNEMVRRLIHPREHMDCGGSF
jgi:hypothetical protein